MSLFSVFCILRISIECQQNPGLVNIVYVTLMNASNYLEKYVYIQIILTVLIIIIIIHLHQAPPASYKSKHITCILFNPLNTIWCKILALFSDFENRAIKNIFKIFHYRAQKQIYIFFSILCCAVYLV